MYFRSITKNWTTILGHDQGTSNQYQQNQSQQQNNMNYDFSQFMPSQRQGQKFQSYQGYSGPTSLAAALESISFAAPHANNVLDWFMYHKADEPPCLALSLEENDRSCCASAASAALPCVNACCSDDATLFRHLNMDESCAVTCYLEET